MTGYDELPAVLSPTTARGKLKAAMDTLDAIVAALQRWTTEAKTLEEKKIVEAKREVLELVWPLVQMAFEAGKESALPTSRRLCPECPKKNRNELAKGRRYCDPCRDLRRRITNRLTKRRSRNKNVSK